MPVIQRYHEQELARLLYSGDHSAFRQLFDEHIRPLVYYSRQICDMQQEAEDAASFAFQQCWNFRQSFTNYSSVRSFLYTTAHNRCLDYLRHKKVVTAASAELLAVHENVHEQTDARIIHAETMGRIYQAIEALPEHHREIIHMSFIEELKVRDIAGKLGKTEAHVRTARARALVVLRTSLAANGLLDVAVFYWLS